jgi:hypothetical protein
MTLDNGPYFMSDLLHEISTLHEKHAALVAQLNKLTKEQQEVRERLNEIEASIAALDGREDLRCEQLAEEKGRRTGQTNILQSLLNLGLPIFLGFMAWFVPNALGALVHFRLDEELKKQLQDRVLSPTYKNVFPRPPQHDP